MGSLKLGYANEQFDREGRGFSDVSENTFRFAYDAILFTTATIRATFDAGQRRGDGRHPDLLPEPGVLDGTAGGGIAP